MPSLQFSRMTALPPEIAHAADSGVCYGMRTTLRMQLRHAVMASALLLSAELGAQRSDVRARVPFTVGEELTYRATFGGIDAGTARLRVDRIDTVRGRPAYHVLLTIDGGIPLFSVKDRYDSWIDVETLSSLRYRQEISEGPYRRTTMYEIYPERLEYQKNSEPIVPTVRKPLDEIAFIYGVRAAGLDTGTTSALQYFKPEGNPVTLTNLGPDTVTVGAGTFAATALRPSIKTEGLFAESTDARIWFSSDTKLYPVQIRTRFSMFTIVLTLESIRP
jgi:hypothetical protein